MKNIESFQTVAHAKCVLSGEHAVIRGYPALVAPITSKMIILSYLNTNEPIQVDAQSPYNETFLLFFWNTWKKGLASLKKDLTHGKFIIKNNIEMGSGLGFSAALCVVVTRWLIWEHWLKMNKMFHFARNLENLFHTKSSGLDIIGAMSNNIVYFKKNGDMHNIIVKWQPKLYLSYSGVNKDTAVAVKKVNALAKKSPKLAQMLDQEMADSVAMFEDALASDDKKSRHKKLISSIQHAEHCFEEWGLITPELEHHIEKLQNLGAIAIKPTGAGGGGYVLSLWNDTPPENADIEFIPVF